MYIDFMLHTGTHRHFLIALDFAGFVVLTADWQGGQKVKSKENAKALTVIAYQ